MLIQLIEIEAPLSIGEGSRATLSIHDLLLLTSQIASTELQLTLAIDSDRYDTATKASSRPGHVHLVLLGSWDPIIATWIYA